MTARRIAVFFCLLTLAFMAGCGNKADEENQKRVTAAIATLPGKVTVEKVEVDGDKLVITGLKAEFPFQVDKPLLISMDEIVCEGVDFDASKTPGVKPFVSKITIKGYTSYTKDAVLDAKGTAAETIFTDGEGDLNALVKLLDEKASAEKLVQAAAGVKFASVETNDYQASAKVDTLDILVTMKHSSVKEVSLLSFSDMTMEDLRVSEKGKQIASIENGSVKLMNVPDVLTLFSDLEGLDDPAKAKENREKIMKAFRAALQDNPMEIQGVVLNKIKVAISPEESLTVEKMGMDFKFAVDEFSITNTVDNLEVPVAAYRAWGPEGALLEKSYGKPLSFSFAFDGNSVPNDEGVFIHLKSLALNENNLGGMNLKLDLSSPKANTEWSFAPENPDDLFLDYSEATLQDKGLIDLVLALQTKQSPEAVKTMKTMYASLLQAGTAQYPNLAELTEGLISLLTKSGTLKVEFNPEDPLKIMGLSAEDIPNIKPIVVEYTPPAK